MNGLNSWLTALQFLTTAVIIKALEIQNSCLSYVAKNFYKLCDKVRLTTHIKMFWIQYGVRLNLRFTLRTNLLRTLDSQMTMAKLVITAQM